MWYCSGSPQHSRESLNTNDWEEVDRFSHQSRTCDQCTYQLKRTEFTKLHSTYWSHCPYDQQPDGCIEETNPTRLWKFDDVHQLIVHQVSLGGGEPGESASVHQSSRCSGPCLEHILPHHCDTVYLFRWLLVYLRRTQINFGSSKYPSPSLLSLIGSLLPYCN